VATFEIGAPVIHTGEVQHTPKTTRRNVLKLAAIPGLSGCSTLPGDKSSRTTATTTQESAHAPPTRSPPLVDSFPFEFVDVFELPESGIYGWQFSGSFNLKADFEVRVISGETISLYVTTGTVMIPENEEEIAFAKRDVARVNEAASFEGASGAILIKVDGQTELSAHVVVRGN